MNKFKYHGIKALDAMNISRLWMIGMTLGRELRALDDMNSLGLWMT